MYALIPPSKGQTEWREAALYRFASQIADGIEPASGLLLGPGGKLYGTTTRGGAWGVGSIFKLEPQPGGWKETVLNSFTGQHGDGAVPRTAPGLIFDRNGAIYGTTLNGGLANAGTVFRLKLH